MRALDARARGYAAAASLPACQPASLQPAAWPVYSLAMRCSWPPPLYPNKSFLGARVAVVSRGSTFWFRLTITQHPAPITQTMDHAEMLMILHFWSSTHAGSMQRIHLQLGMPDTTGHLHHLKRTKERKRNNKTMEWTEGTMPHRVHGTTAAQTHSQQARSEDFELWSFDTTLDLWRILGRGTGRLEEL